MLSSAENNVTDPDEIQAKSEWFSITGSSKWLPGTTYTSL